VLVATSQQDVQDLVDRLHRVSGKHSLLLNKEKTKVMSTEENPCMISVDGKVMRQR